MVTYAAVDSRCICVISDFGAELDRDDSWDPARRFPAYCVELASDPTQQFRLVMVMTPEAFKRREQQLPLLRNFPRVEVPQIRDDELLALWICQLPVLEDVTGIEFTLARMLDRLVWRAPDRWRDFASHADLLCESELTGCERSLRGFMRSVQRKQWTVAQEQRLERYVQSTPPLASWVDPKRWPEFVALADAVRGVS